VSTAQDVLTLAGLALVASFYLGGLAASLVAISAALRGRGPLQARQLPAVLLHVVLAILWPAVWGWERAERLLER
jgi:hypothetical protein